MSQVQLVILDFIPAAIQELNQLGYKEPKLPLPLLDPLLEHLGGAARLECMQLLRSGYLGRQWEKVWINPDRPLNRERPFGPAPRPLPSEAAKHLATRWMRGQRVFTPSDLKSSEALAAEMPQAPAAFGISPTERAKHAKRVVDEANRKQAMEREAALKAEVAARRAQNPTPQEQNQGRPQPPEPGSEEASQLARVLDMLLKVQQRHGGPFKRWLATASVNSVHERGQEALMTLKALRFINLSKPPGEDMMTCQVTPRGEAWLRQQTYPEVTDEDMHVVRRTVAKRGVRL